jgi:hypothetical protein
MYSRALHHLSIHRRLYVLADSHAVHENHKSIKIYYKSGLVCLFLLKTTDKRWNVQKRFNLQQVVAEEGKRQVAQS